MIGLVEVNKGLPAWQLGTASSPGRPSEENDLLDTKVAEVDGLTLHVGKSYVRNDRSRLELRSPLTEHG